MTTKDRMADFRAAQQAHEQANNHLNDTMDDNCVVTFSEVQRNDSMQDFFTEVEHLRSRIDTIANDVEEIKKLHTTILTAPHTDEKLKMHLEDKMAEITRTAKAVRHRLKEMEEVILDQTKNPKSTAELRIKKTQHQMLTTRIVNVMQTYNEMQNDYRERCKQRIQRQLEITGRTTTDEQLDEMLESGNPAIFTQGILTDTQQARQTMAEIQARHAEIINLEKSIKELHDMFLDMAMLVDQQGDMIDRIETHVQSAGVYVTQAKEQTTKAVEYQSSARRKKLICMLIALVAIIIIVVIIVFSVAKKN